MVLPLKRWKSRASPGIKAGALRVNPFTCQGLLGQTLKGPFAALFVFYPSKPVFGDAGWSSPVARQAHNLKVAGSNPAPATKEGPGFPGLFLCAFAR